MSAQQNPGILTRDTGMDLCEATAQVARGTLRATALVESSIERAHAAVCRHAFIRYFDTMARAAAAAVDSQREAGAPVPPLAGLAVSVKDLYDIAGQPSTAASRSLADAAPDSS
jgi:amidase/aspartyl-tRNA(Asn)/glutamyl-tRNA(Gln) amidotransferase subunit A